MSGKNARARYQQKRGKMRCSRYKRKIRQQLWDEEMSRQGLVCCKLCGMPIAFEETTLDHIVPIAHGGPHHKSNLQLAHQHCNFKKGSNLCAESDT